MKILKPAVASLGPFKVEHASIDNFLGIYSAVYSFNDLCAMIELTDQAEKSFLRLLIDLDSNPLDNL